MRVSVAKVWVGRLQSLLRLGDARGETERERERAPPTNHLKAKAKRDSNQPTARNLSELVGRWFCFRLPFLICDCWKALMVWVALVACVGCVAWVA